MEDRSKPTRNPYNDTQFFRQLTVKRLLGTFTFINLAAGKLPFSPERSPFRALRDEKPAGPFDNGTDHITDVTNRNHDSVEQVTD